MHSIRTVTTTLKKPYLIETITHARFHPVFVIKPDCKSLKVNTNLLSPFILVFLLDEDKMNDGRTITGKERWGMTSNTYL